MKESKKVDMSLLLLKMFMFKGSINSKSFKRNSPSVSIRRNENIFIEGEIRNKRTSFQSTDKNPVRLIRSESFENEYTICKRFKENSS